MDHSHLRRLTRPIVRSAAAPPAPTATLRAAAAPGDVSPAAAPAPRGLPARPATRAASWDVSGQPVSAAARARRRRPVAACEVCGRTLLTGETSRQITSGDLVLEACALCAISATRAGKRRAA
jgi:hypothetical protein